MFKFYWLHSIRYEFLSFQRNTTFYRTRNHLSQSSSVIEMRKFLRIVVDNGFGQSLTILITSLFYLSERSRLCPSLLYHITVDASRSSRDSGADSSSQRYGRCAPSSGRQQMWPGGRTRSRTGTRCLVGQIMGKYSIHGNFGQIENQRKFITFWSLSVVCH